MGRSFLPKASQRKCNSREFELPGDFIVVATFWSLVCYKKSSNNVRGGLIKLGRYIFLLWNDDVSASLTAHCWV